MSRIAEQPDRRGDEKAAQVRSPRSCPVWSDESDGRLLMQYLAKKAGNACDRRKAVRVLVLHREHEGIRRDGVGIGPPRDEPRKKSIVASSEHVDRVRAEALLDLIEAGLWETDVGVILLSP